MFFGNGDATEAALKEGRNVLAIYTSISNSVMSAWRVGVMRDSERAEMLMFGKSGIKRAAVPGDDTTAELSLLEWYGHHICTCNANYLELYV